MAEGLVLALEFASARCGSIASRSTCSPANTRSQELVGASGFAREGYSHRYLRIGGRWRDHVRYALLADDGAPGRQAAAMAERRSAAEGRALALAVVDDAAYAPAPLTLEEPAVVSAVPLPPYESRDVCVRLGSGDRLEYTFESTGARDVRNPVSRGRGRDRAARARPTRSDAGVFLARLARDYCLVWEAGPAGALLDYRLRRRPAAMNAPAPAGRVWSTSTAR